MPTVPVTRPVPTRLAATWRPSRSSTATDHPRDAAAASVARSPGSSGATPLSQLLRSVSVAAMSSSSQRPIILSTRRRELMSSSSSRTSTTRYLGGGTQRTSSPRRPMAQKLMSTEVSKPIGLGGRYTVGPPMLEGGLVEEQGHIGLGKVEQVRQPAGGDPPAVPRLDGHRAEPDRLRFGVARLASRPGRAGLAARAGWALAVGGASLPLEVGAARVVDPTEGGEPGHDRAVAGAEVVAEPEHLLDGDLAGGVGVPEPGGDPAGRQQERGREGAGAYLVQLVGAAEGPAHLAADVLLVDEQVGVGVRGGEPPLGGRAVPVQDHARAERLGEQEAAEGTGLRMERLDRDLHALAFQQRHHRWDRLAIPEPEAGPLIGGQAVALLGRMAGRQGIGGELVALRPERGKLQPGVVVEPVAHLLDDDQVAFVEAVVGAEVPDRRRAGRFDQAAR